MNFRYKLMQFMSGRYGFDSLFYLLFAIATVVFVVNFFIGSLLLQIIIDVILIFAVFRVLSRNIEARRRENYIFEQVKIKFKNRQSIIRQRKADYNHVYKKCPRCKAVLRLPRKKGKHTTVCPRCSKEFKVYVFKA